MDSDILFLKLCRTCLVITSTENVHPIFENNVNNMISDCLSLQVEKEDKLTQVICSQCAHLIHEFFKFKQKSKTNEIILKDFLNKTDKKELIKFIEPFQNRSDSSETKTELLDSNELPRSPSDSVVKNPFNKLVIKPDSLKIHLDSIKREPVDTKDEIDDYLDFFPEIEDKNDFFSSKDNKTPVKIKINPSKKRKCRVFNHKNKNLKKEKDSWKSLDSSISILNDSNEASVKIDVKNEAVKSDECESDDDIPLAKTAKLCSKQNKNKENKRNSPIFYDRDKNIFECKTCERTFSTNSALQRHGETHERQTETCPECKKVFTNKFSLYQHLKRHGEPNFSCTYAGCTQKYFFLDKLIKHTRTKHDAKKTIECADCNEKFYVKQQLDAHLKKNFYHALAKVNKEAYRCPSTGCNITFLSVFQMGYHVAKIHKFPKVFECQLCHCRYHLKDQLDKHTKFCSIRHSSNEKLAYNCPEKDCLKTYEELHQLALHVQRKHNFSKSNACKWCGASFCLKLQLQRHIEEEEHQLEGNFDANEVKSGLEAVLCQTCGKSVRQINKHMLEHKKEANLGFKCLRCHVGFATRQLLQSHVRREHTEASICHYCGKNYKSPKHIMWHEKEEAKEMGKQTDGKITLEGKSVPCDICGKMFKTKTRMSEHRSLVHHPKIIVCHICTRPYPKKALKRHILLVHQEQRNYPCSVCQYKCKTDAHLKTHMRQHTDERPHPCPFCAQAFRQRTTLQNHIRRHTGEKPHVCKICNKRFIQRHAMLTHMKTHSNERAYPCTVCERAFSQPAALSTHLQSHVQASFAEQAVVSTPAAVQVTY